VCVCIYIYIYIVSFTYVCTYTLVCTVCVYSNKYSYLHNTILLLSFKPYLPCRKVNVSVIGIQKYWNHKHTNEITVNANAIVKHIYYV